MGGDFGLASLKYSIGPVLLLMTMFASISGCEYEWRDIPAVVDAQKASPAAQVEVVSVPKEVKESVAVLPPDVRPTLAPGKDVSGHDALPDKSKKIDLIELVESGQLLVSSNSGSPDLTLAFDERDDTLAKSEGVNPFRLNFEFVNARLIKAVKVLSSYSDYGLAIQIDDGDRLVVDSVVDGNWSTVALASGVKAKKFYVEVLRKSRDNFVHLNEIELYE